MDGTRVISIVQGWMMAFVYKKSQSRALMDTVGGLMMPILPRSTSILRAMRSWLGLTYA